MPVGSYFKGRLTSLCISKRVHQPPPLAGKLLSPRRYISTSDLGANSIVFSGIQPTGIPHIGNWFGALRQWVKLQESEARLVFAIADLHALTVPQDASVLRRWRREAFASLLAIGLDPRRCTLFFQSDVPAHAELMWILSCVSPVGYLTRMTTWKSKCGYNDESSTLEDAAKSKARLGLLAYPVLQAADILVHGANYVPVGADQGQHLEFARECARNFNNMCNDRIFEEPLALYSDAPRLMSLRDPAQKMSKSHPDPRSRIMLTDSREDIERKIRLSLTDSRPGISFLPEERPGIANLLRILSLVDAEGRSPQDLATELKDHSLHGLKELVSNRVHESLSPIREAFLELTEISRNSNRLEEIAYEGANQARSNAANTIERVKLAVGL